MATDLNGKMNGRDGHTKRFDVKTNYKDMNSDFDSKL
jgi:hypothetical protein